VLGHHPDMVLSMHTWFAGLQVADLQSQVVGLSSQLEVRQQRLEAAQTAADLAVEQVGSWSKDAWHCSVGPPLRRGTVVY
jgi:hypothetical protein